MVDELVQSLGITPAEARRRLSRAVTACGGQASDLAPLLGVTKGHAKRVAARYGCQLARRWERQG